MSDAAGDNEESIPLPIWLKKAIPFGGYTYKDYKKWEEGLRVELVNGIPRMMASPNEWHQWVIRRLLSQLDQQLNGKVCTPYSAPFDVRLFYEEDESDKIIFQPDILVVCDPEKLKSGHGVKGTPDFIIVILSEFNAGYDLIDKKSLYEKAGVKEYWIVSRDKLYVNILHNRTYQETVIPLDKSFKTKDYKQNIETLNCILDFTDIIKRYNL